MRKNKTFGSRFDFGFGLGRACGIAAAFSVSIFTVVSVYAAPPATTSGPVSRERASAVASPDSGKPSAVAGDATPNSVPKSDTPAPEDSDFVRIYHHRPMYLIWGRPDTKVQFSLKARALKNFDLYFAYTQLMFWDFFHESKPFHDINFNPEVFYRFNSSIVTTDIGIEHESNGKEGAVSRSWNRVTLKFIREFALDGDRALRGEFRTWYPYGLEDNRDLRRYKGQYEFHLIVQNLFGSAFGFSELGFRFYPGGKSTINPFQSGGRELSLRLRTKNSYDFFHVVIQAFEGRGEELLDYKEHRYGLRAGVGF